MSKLKYITTMNSIVFMPRIASHCGRGGIIVDLPSTLLTLAIVGAILIVFGTLVNILDIKFTRGFGHTPIHWVDIKPGFDNTFLGCLCGIFGGAFVGTAVLVGLAAGIYEYIVSL